MNYRSMLFSAGAVIAIGLPSVVYAQEAPRAASNDANEPGDADIVVTAQKRSESAVKVPITINVLSGPELERRNITELRGALLQISGVSLGAQVEGSRGSVSPSIRGLQIGDQATVSEYIDDMPVSPVSIVRVGLPNPEMFDVQRLEVLKGPQGTLYGAASMGGTIRILLNKPDPTKFEGRVVGTGSKYAGGGFGYRFDGMLNVPLAQDLALRVSGTQDKQDGYIRTIDGAFYLANIYRGGAATNFPGVSLDKVISGAYRPGYNNNSSLTSLRATVAWTPGNLRIAPFVLYQDIKDTGGRQTSVAIYGKTNQIVFPIFNNGYNPSYNNWYMVNLPIELKTDFGTFTSSTGYWSGNYGAGLPIARTITVSKVGGVTDAQLLSVQNPVLQNKGTESNFVQEFRFASDFHGPFNFVAGLFHRHIKTSWSQTASGPDYAAIFGTPVFLYYAADETYNENAAFAQGNLMLGHSLEVTGGVRFYKYNRPQVLQSTGTIASPGYNSRVEQSGQTYAFSASFYPGGKETANSQVYVRAASGFRPGYSASNGALSPDCLAELGGAAAVGGNRILQDSVWTYEFGGKYRSTGGALSVSAAVYQTDWKDIQLVRRLQCGTAISANAGSARVRGAEGEIALNPVDWVQLNLVAGYIDPRFQQAVPSQGYVVNSPIPNVSKWTGSATVNFRPAAVSSFGGYAQFNMTYNSDGYLGPGQTIPYNSISYPRRGLTLFNIKVGGERDKWSAAVFANNIFNLVRTGQCNDSGLPVPGERTGCVSDPRLIGIQLGRKF